ncbi:MAG: indole-3-glycerol phosphate synthase TrpC, partial [Candidatus Sericytochromatia bacterium]
GASCLSVLTEEAHFQGHLGRLAEVRAVVGLPLLQKDFLVDPYQVYEARAAGADAILLIAAILDDARLAELAAVAASLGLDALLEVHDEDELERAVRVPTPMLGINNRNLKTYAIDLGTTGALVTVLGDRRGDRLIVGESGVRTASDVQRLVVAGADAVLVGEAMMRQPDLGAAYRSLFGEPACDVRA